MVNIVSCGCIIYTYWVLSNCVVYLCCYLYYLLSDLDYKKDGNAFGWGERYKVALGIAKALDYVHNGPERPVIHKDVKSSNVLLLDDFEPQVLYSKSFCIICFF